MSVATGQTSSLEISRWYFEQGHRGIEWMWCTILTSNVLFLPCRRHDCLDLRTTSQAQTVQPVVAHVLPPRHLRAPTQPNCVVIGPLRLGRIHIGSPTCMPTSYPSILTGYAFVKLYSCTISPLHCKLSALLCLLFQPRPPISQIVSCLQL